MGSACVHSVFIRLFLFLITADKSGSRTRVVFNFEPNFGMHVFKCFFVTPTHKWCKFASVVAQVFRSFSEESRCKKRGQRWLGTRVLLCALASACATSRILAVSGLRLMRCGCLLE